MFPTSPASGVRQPGCRPVPVQTLRCTQRGDHELDGGLDIPGQLEALRRRVAFGRRELLCRCHHGAGQTGQFRGVPGIERPPRSPGRGSQARDLITQPGPRIRAQGGIPEPGRRLVAREPRMVVGSGEAAWRTREAVKQIGPPQRAVDDGELGRRLTPSMRMARKLPDLDPGTMLHRSVVKVDLEPVPDGDGRAGKSQNVLHCAPLSWIWTCRLSMGRSERPGQRNRRRPAGVVRRGCRWRVIEGGRAAIFWDPAGLYQRGHHDELGSPRDRGL
jgi:hypothetical protein